MLGRKSRQQNNNHTGRENPTAAWAPNHHHGLQRKPQRSKVIDSFHLPKPLQWSSLVSKKESHANIELDWNALQHQWELAEDWGGLLSADRLFWLKDSLMKKSFFIRESGQQSSLWYADVFIFVLMKTALKANCRELNYLRLTDLKLNTN